MVYAGILAAGLGVRMNRQDIPKQFLPLGDKPIIIHTLEQFFVNPTVERIIIVVPREWKQYADDLLQRHNLTYKEYAIIEGGKNKTESISLIAHYIDKIYGINEDDMLIAHDAIRPFVTQRLIDEHISVTAKVGAANTAICTNDAILISHDGVSIESVPPHEYIYAEQTPQSYLLPILKEMLKRTSKENILLESENEFPRLWRKFGFKMNLVRGDYFNMKLINPYDLEVANALLKELKL